MTIIQDLAAYSEFDTATSCGVNKAVSESRFPSLAFSSSTAIIPPCLGTLTCSCTAHSSDKFRRRFALASSAQSLVTCHCKLSCFCSCILSLIRVSKKGSRTSCRQHLWDDPAKSFRMPVASISTHWLIAISSGLTDFPGSVPEASLECCSVRPFSSERQIMFWKGMISLGLQCKCYSAWSPVITAGILCWRTQVHRSSNISDLTMEGRAGERWNSTTVTGPFTNTGLQCPSPETSTAYGSAPLWTKVAGRSAIVRRSARWETVCDPLGLIRLEVCVIP